MDELPVQYIAGVLDAVGVFKLRKVPGSGTKLAQISVHGMPPEVLRVLAQATGTTVVKTERKYHGVRCAEHCTESHVDTTSTSHKWVVTGAKALVLLSTVMPYLRAKRDKAAPVLDEGMAAPYKPETMRKMERLGWDVSHVA